VVADSPGDSSAQTAPRADRPHRNRGGRRRAAGIYGTIVTAAVLASGGAKMSTAALAVAALVTLIVYWVAEEYAEILGGQAEDGRLPTGRQIFLQLTSTWPMVSAAYIPVVTLVVARIAGTSAVVAANIALCVTVLLLLFHGWSAGRAADLRGGRLIVGPLIAGALGAVMIVLKNFVVTNLH
jgi:hypothetical protein